MVFSRQLTFTFLAYGPAYMASLYGEHGTGKGEKPFERTTRRKLAFGQYGERGRHVYRAMLPSLQQGGLLRGIMALRRLNKPMEFIMFSQRKLSSPSDRGFVQMIWSAILLVQTRETSSLINRRRH